MNKLGNANDGVISMVVTEKRIDRKIEMIEYRYFPSVQTHLNIYFVYSVIKYNQNTKSDLVSQILYRRINSEIKSKNTFSLYYNT